MTHYPDLSTSCMVEQGPQVRVVGWLNPGFPFETGSVSPEFMSKLKQQCVTPYRPMVLMGAHECEFKPDSSTQCQAPGHKNLWIPGANGCLYVAPEMIVHYIETHGYKPPEEFIQTVLAAPAQKSPEYWRMMEPFGHSEPILYGLPLHEYEALSRDEQYKLQLRSKRTPEWEQANPVEAAVVHGLEQAEMGNHLEAAKALETAVPERNKDQQFLLVFADSCQKCGRYQDAINVSSDIAARNQEYPGTVTRGKDALLIRALAYQGLQDYTNARADFSVVIERDQDCVAAFIGLSECSEALGLSAEAANYREQANKLAALFGPTR